MMLPWRKIAAWYKTHGRDLPWRRTKDPYRIAVSEFMLQQTQVDRVVPLHQSFIKLFPSWKALARAPQADVVRAWKGLGYNLRAVRLKKMAEEIVSRYGGALPEDGNDLLSLKGVGPYTARALRVFAFRKRALAPDTNLRRVLNRFFKGPTSDPKRFDERAWKAWEAMLPQQLSYEVNQGLMDLGAAVCKAGRPNCSACPLTVVCRSYPRILKLKNLPKQKVAKYERVDRFGLPNRIYRGRVIDFLRSQALPYRNIDVLGRAVRAAYDHHDRAWLVGILAALEKDGLVEKKSGRYRLA